MANNDWYPRKLAARAPWHSNMNNAAQATGLNHGLNALQLTAIARDAANVALVANYTNEVGQFAQAVTTFQEIMLRGGALASLPAVPVSPTQPVLEDG